MSRISIPIDMVTSRLNLSERFEGMRSQSIAQRFSNLKPVSEFFDVKRLSKPRDFGDVQARVNYNLGYFSSNYAVVFVMLSIYALLTNTWLLFDIVFVSVSVWIVGRLGGRDLEIGNFRATSSQLYTGIACISIPIAIIAGPIGTFLWLTNRECFFRGGRVGAAGPPELLPPHWRRAQGARLGRNRGGVYGVHRSWSNDERLQEIGTEDEDNFLHPDPRYGYDDAGRFYSDELHFDGLDYNTRYTGYGRPDGYYDESEFSENDGHYAGTPLRREGSRQSMFTDWENEMAERALEKIARARALGKTNVNLSQAEIDSLERMNRAEAPQPVSQPAAKPSPATKKTSKQKTIEASKKKRGDSPKSKPVQGRVRNRSNASSRSNRDDDVISYSLPAEPSYDYVGRASEIRPVLQGSPLRPGGSRSGSSSNIRGMAGGPPLITPYYQGQRYVSMPEGPYHRRMESAPTRLRADSARSDSRSRSNSNVRPYPIDQLPNPSQAGRAPRFDPSDPRFGSPSRRVASGPPYGHPPMSRRQSEEMFSSNEAEVMGYMVSGSSRSNSDSDASYHDNGVTVDVTEKPGSKTGYSIKTRSAAVASGSASKPAAATKSGSKATVRRR